MPRLTQFLAQQWFLLCLAAMLFVGMWWHEPLAPLAGQKWLQNAIVFVVLFLMTLPLAAAAFVRTVRRPAAPLLAFGITYGVIPLLAWGLVPLVAPSLAEGLLIAACTPCTQASAAVWTRRAGGDAAIAIVVTIATNLTCFLATPFWLKLTTGREVALDVYQMIGLLALTVVLPIVVAQALRLIEPVARFATQHGKRLSIAAQAGLLLMVLFGAIKTGEAWGQSSTTWDVLAMIPIVLLIHSLALTLGMCGGRAVGLPRESWIAVGFSGSQKTLMVGLLLADRYFGGLAMLPMLTYHVGQLLIDTFVADWLRRHKEPPK